MNWKKLSFHCDEEKIRFENLPYPPYLLNLETRYQFFHIFLTNDFFENVAQESKRYYFQKNPARDDMLTVAELRQYIVHFLSIRPFSVIQIYDLTGRQKLNFPIFLKPRR